MLGRCCLLRGRCSRCRVRVSPCGGLSCCCSRAPSSGSIDAAHGRSCSAAGGNLPDRTSKPGSCTGGRILAHWVAREAPPSSFIQCPCFRQQVPSASWNGGAGSHSTEEAEPMPLASLGSWGLLAMILSLDWVMRAGIGPGQDLFVVSDDLTVLVSLV